MTLSAQSKLFGRGLPSTNDIEIANQLRQILASAKEGEATLNLIEPNTKEKLNITLSPAISGIFLELLRHIGSGKAVTLVPMEQELTTKQAADLLNVSRPYLINLLEEGKINYNLVGRHRRILAKDVFEYKENRDAKRRKALDDLISDDADLI